MSKTAKKKSDSGEKPGSAKRQNFQLNKNNATVIVAILALVGTLVTATFASVGTIFAAVLNSRGNVQAEQAADGQGQTLIAYHDQCMEEINNSLNTNERTLLEAEAELGRAKKTPDQQANLIAVENTLVTLRERRDAVNAEYKNFTTALNGNKPVDAAIRKSRINKLLNRTQKEINDRLSSPSLEKLRRKIWLQFGSSEEHKMTKEEDFSRT